MLNKVVNLDALESMPVSVFIEATDLYISGEVSSLY